ncbi:MAG: indole-3-glycerol phosphate synthase TrpC [Coleofasciculaceae cyanobacterium RL_1_1]|nr:indole-3-glycerol phosphate synthase TrpC [Coleofasciculaceae cyanobacterium RL_1_1]
MQIRRRHPNPSVQADTCSYQVPIPGAEPQHILEEIVWYKETEVERWRSVCTLIDLRRAVQMKPAALDFVGALRSGKTKPALIAEVKKASPSKGIICENFDPEAIATAYAQGGASCISVLTDTKFFQGGFDILDRVRATVDLPLLCKDFIIYPYQIYKARAHGADAILLIAAILQDRDLSYFLKIARTLGMAALIEVHTLAELDRVLAINGVELIGINNRNLEDFSVDLATSEALIAARRDAITAKNITLVSESGLYTSADLDRVATAGANAVLIGESLVKQADPQAAIAALFEPQANA